MDGVNVRIRGVVQPDEEEKTFEIPLAYGYGSRTCLEHNTIPLSLLVVSIRAASLVPRRFVIPHHPH